MPANSAVTRELKEMHEQTQSIHQQSDQYADESELPFTAPPLPPAGDRDPSAAGPLFDGEQPAPRLGAKGEPHDILETAAE
jgi:hypothetical protein